MENNDAIKLIDKILVELDSIDAKASVDNIKKLRTYALEAQVPLVVKVLRLTYEHIEQYGAFLIPILDDEPINEEHVVTEVEDISSVESLKYLLSLIKNLKHKGNVSDLREYRDLLMAY